MTDKGDKQSAVWPLPKFYFRVDVGGSEMTFQEVTGLDAEVQVPDYRAGDNKVFSNVKMPGMAKAQNLTLKRGVFVNDNRIQDWFNAVEMNTIIRQSVKISLLDKNGAPTMVWALANAFPVKVIGTDLKAEGNEVAVETIELVHEGITIEYSGGAG